MRRSFAVLLAALLVDQMNAGMMLPVLPSLFTNPDSPALLIDKGSTEVLGAVMIAALGAAYALPAFVAQPVLGQLADRFGRKKLLVAAFSGSVLSYVLFAAGIMMESIPLLIGSRAVDGITGANVLVAQAAVADMTEEGERTRYFGYFTGALSVGFVLGPLLGGWLGAPDGPSWTGPAVAFWGAAALNLLVVLVFAWQFKETLGEDERDTDEDFETARAFTNAKEAFGDGERRPYYLVLFLYAAGYTFFTTFYSVVLEDRVGMETQAVGTYFAVLGAGFAVVQLFLVDRLQNRFGAGKTLWLALFATAASLVVAGLATAPWMAYAVIPLFALGNGLVEPLVTSLISTSAGGREQGRVQGVRGSVDALGRVGPPFLSAPLASLGSPVWPVLAGAGVMAAGGAVALRFLGKGEDEPDDDEPDDDPESHDPESAPEASGDGAATPGDTPEASATADGGGGASGARRAPARPGGSARCGRRGGAARGRR